MSEKFDGRNAVISAGISLIVAGLTVLFTGLFDWAINRESIEANRVATEASLELAKKVADEQTELTKRLAELEAWRETPRINVLQTVQTGKCNVVTTIQNEGAKQLVLFAIRCDWLTTLTEPKEASLNPAVFVDTAQRSSVLPIDLTTKTLDIPYIFEPPIVIAPGEVLTLNVELNPLSRPCSLNLQSNDPEGWTHVGFFRQLP